MWRRKWTKAGMRRLFIIASVFILSFRFQVAAKEAKFSFESLTSIEKMTEFVRKNAPLNTQREAVRAIFVNEGKATLKIHPTQKGVEKYLYDINLCNYYIWRWNISADFDDEGKLRQAYVNAVPIFSDGKPPRDPRSGLAPNQKATIYRMQRPRPEATKGKNSHLFFLFDGDANLKTIDDQEFLGGVPTKADPLDMGKLTVVKGEPWRSIFDFDAANFIAQYAGNCAAVDAEMARRRR